MAAIASVVVVGVILTIVFQNGNGESIVDKPSPQPQPPGNGAKDDVPEDPKDPVELPVPKAEPEEAVVWIGYRIGRTEYRHGTGFAISPSTIVTAGWHSVWLDGALDDEELTLLVGVGSKTTRVRSVDVVPIEGDGYGLLKIEIQPFDDVLKPVDPATVGEPPKPGTPIQWITWSEWTGDAIPFRNDAFFRAAVKKGVSWKFEFKDPERSFDSKYAGSPIVIGRRVVGILALAVDGDAHVLTLKPVLGK
jgi:hypothetical protein